MSNAHTDTKVCALWAVVCARCHLQAEEQFKDLEHIALTGPAKKASVFELWVSDIL